MRMMTEPRPVFSAQSETTANFIPFTEALNSTDVQKVLLGVYLEQRSFENIEVRPAYQYSNDGVTWDTPIGVDLSSGSPYTTASGWTFRDSVLDLESGVTPKLFVRFGVQVLNVDASPDDTKSQGGMVRLCVQSRPLPAGTEVYDYTKVNSQGDATATFTPLGPALDATAITALRATFEMLGTAGDNLQIGPSYQVSYDGITWTNTDGGASGTFNDIGTQVRASDGTTYPSGAGSPGWDNTGLSFKFPYIRFGIRAVNLYSDTSVRASLARLRVDWRTT